MFDRFDEGARRIMIETRNRAIQRGRDAIGLEDLFMVLVADDDHLLERALGGAGVDPGALVARIQSLLPSGDPLTDQARLPFTPGAKRALEAALADAEERGDAHLTVAHLSVGTLVAADTAFGRSRIKRVLAEGGVALRAVRVELDRIRGAESDGMTGG